MNTVRERNAFASADNRAGMSAMPASPGTTSGRITAPHGVGGRAERALGVCRGDAGDTGRARGRSSIGPMALMAGILIRDALGDRGGDATRTEAEKDPVNGMPASGPPLSPSTVSAIGSAGDRRLTHASESIGGIFSVLGLERMGSGRMIPG